MCARTSPPPSSFVPQEDQKYWTKKDVLDVLTSPSISEHRWAAEPAAPVSNSLRGGQRVSAAIAYEGEGCPENRMGITEHDASCARIHAPAVVDHLDERLLERLRRMRAFVDHYLASAAAPPAALVRTLDPSTDPTPGPQASAVSHPPSQNRGSRPLCMVAGSRMPSAPLPGVRAPALPRPHMP